MQPATTFYYCFFFFFDALDVFLSILFSLLNNTRYTALFLSGYNFLSFSVIVAVICAVNNCIWNHKWKSLPDYLWNILKKKNENHLVYVGRERKKNSMPKNLNTLVENLIPILCQFIYFILPGSRKCNTFLTILEEKKKKKTVEKG